MNDTTTTAVQVFRSTLEQLDNGHPVNAAIHAAYDRLIDAGQDDWAEAIGSMDLDPTRQEAIRDFQALLGEALGDEGTCVWCGEPERDDEAGVIAERADGDHYHEGCWTSAQEEADRDRGSRIRF